MNRHNAFSNLFVNESFIDSEVGPTIEPFNGARALRDMIKTNGLMSAEVLSHQMHSAMSRAETSSFTPEEFAGAA